jgi:pimeloyl-ACP methyl ester carboxylesterase
VLLSLLLAAVHTVASADGVPIRYEASGKGGPAIVFVHGWCCDRHYWDAQIPHFAKTHRVVALDLGGHGESGRGRKAWTVSAFADDVKAVVNALHLERVVLVGHSMGGPVIVEAARKMPTQALAIVPVDIFNSVGTNSSPEAREAFIAPMETDFKTATKEFVAKYLFNPGTDPTLVERISSAMASMPTEIGVGAMRGLWAYDSAQALADVKVPIHVINSDRRSTDLEAARRYAPQFEMVAMKGVGHFVMIEDPATFNRLLDEELAQLAGPAAR